jgi:hypothetical protein
MLSLSLSGSLGEHYVRIWKALLPLITKGIIKVNLELHIPDAFKIRSYKTAPTLELLNRGFPRNCISGVGWGVAQKLYAVLS